MKKLNNNNPYNNKCVNIEKELYELNEQLAITLKHDKKKNLVLTSLGNSIATGYSMKDMIKPLLLRNEQLKPILKWNGIDTNYHSYARAQNNNDDHIFEWISKNIKESEINRQVHMDFGHKETSMYTYNFTEEDVNKFYPLDLDNDMGIKDLISINEEKTANIIVYNGYTGSFLDNITRKGKHYSTYGFKRDLVSLEAVLKQIYYLNPNTQVYVCGVPNLLKIHATDLVNRKLKKVCLLYPNVTYVESAPGNLIYKKDGSLTIDPHHSIFEYLILNKNIIKSINNNYFKNKMFAEFDQALRKYSQMGEFENHDIRNDKVVIDTLITNLFDKYYNYITKKDLKELVNFFKEKYPHDYYYTNKKEMLDVLKEEGRQI